MGEECARRVAMQREGKAEVGNKIGVKGHFLHFFFL